MAWGAAGTRGVDDWVQRLASNDASLTSIHVFRDRRFGVEVSSFLLYSLYPDLQGA